MMSLGTPIAAVDFGATDAGEFHDRLDTEHLPERAAVPGFLTLQRWIGADNPGLSLVVYDLQTPAVLQGSAYSAITGANASPWSQRMTSRVQRVLRSEGEQHVRDTVTGRVRMVCKAYIRS